MCKKNIYRFATKTRHQIALYPTLLKRCTKIDVFYYTSDTRDQCNSAFCAHQLTALRNYLCCFQNTSKNQDLEFVFIKLHFCIDPMTIMVSHQVVPHILQHNCTHSQNYLHIPQTNINLDTLCIYTKVARSLEVFSGTFCFQN